MRKYLSIALLLGLAGSANAAISVFLDSQSSGGGISTYNYRVDQAGGDILRAGDFFTIYDFAGLIETGPNDPDAPVGFNFTIQPFGMTPGPTPTSGGANPFQDTGISNVTFTSQGDNATPVITGFVLRSTLNGPNTNIPFTGRSTKASGPQAGSDLDSTGAVAGPTSSVPEPASMGLMGGALTGLAFLIRRRR